MKQWIIKCLDALLDAFSKKAKPKPDMLQKRESTYIVEFLLLSGYLTSHLGEQVFCTFENHCNAVRIHTQFEDIAMVNVFPKGHGRSMTYVTVRIEKCHHGLHIWFKAAFIDYKVSFLQPVLKLTRRVTHTPPGK